MRYPTFYRTIRIDGLSIFYRETGPQDAPTLLLLHGLPSSSRMFGPLFSRLSDRYHLVAPDYPGFGHSDWPDPKQFAYTFDHYAKIMNRFTEALGISRYTLYMQDYGGPVGFRMALDNADRIEALIVQDAVAHNEGLGANWKTRRAYWADRVSNENALRTNLLSLAAARTRHVGNDPNIERYDPDLWTDEFAFLSQPGQAEIQSDLFYDCRTNVELGRRADWQPIAGDGSLAFAGAGVRLNSFFNSSIRPYRSRRNHFRVRRGLIGIECAVAHVLRPDGV